MVANSLRQKLGFLIIPVFLCSCGMLGIHFRIHNPGKATPYPDFNRETILLGELTPVRDNFDVTFYNLDVLIDPKEKRLSGWVEIQAKAKKDIDSIQIDLDQPLKVLEIRMSERNGTQLPYRREFRAIFIQMPQTLTSEEKFSVHIKYDGKPMVAKKPPWKGGLVWDKSSGKPFVGVACETDGASIWFPCKDHTSDEADSARMQFTIPDPSLTVVSNGRLKNTESTDEGKKYTWKVVNPINTYNITFYVGDYVNIPDTLLGINGKTLDLNHYVLWKNRDRAIEHFKQVKWHIRIFEEIWGEYPWYEDGFKLVESPYAGMEHQSAIAYGDRYENYILRTDDHIILHETGHEWFGNAVSAADLADVWLQEGITTYGEALYLEKAYGKHRALEHLLLFRLFIKNERPLVGIRDRRFFDYRDADVYLKSAWVLHSLRTTVENDSLFFAAIRTFYQENKMKLTNTQTFVETFNRVSGKDYTWFFDQYLYNRKVPMLEYCIVDDAIYYHWTEVSDSFDKLPVHVALEYKSVTLYPTTRVQQYRYPENVDPSGIEFYTDEALYGVKKKRGLNNLY